MSKPLHGQKTETEILDVFGVNIRITMPSAVTNGALSMFEEHNKSGAGPPLHVHHDADEIFTVVSGEYNSWAVANPFPGRREWLGWALVIPGDGLACPDFLFRTTITKGPSVFF